MCLCVCVYSTLLSIQMLSLGVQDAPLTHFYIFQTNQSARFYSDDSLRHTFKALYTSIFTLLCTSTLSYFRDE